MKHVSECLVENISKDATEISLEEEDEEEEDEDEDDEFDDYYCDDPDDDTAATNTEKKGRNKQRDIHKNISSF